MDRLTYVFPLALAAFLVLLGAESAPCLREKQLFPGTARRWTKRDSLCLGVITAIYAAAAFLGLGDATGVQSFCSFEGEGRYALVTFRVPEDVASLRYFSGLGMGEYRVQLSEDGETWFEAGSMEQGHVQIFKWNELLLPEDRPARSRYLRVTASRALWLGELAIYDGMGELLDAAAFSCPEPCAALFDEQDRIPAAYDYHNSTYFDEIYHARTAYENIEHIYPYEISHPPLGKLILSLGIRAFGLTPFGWRFSGTLVGVLMLPAIYVFLKRMFGGTAVPACCAAVLASDFMHYVQTRIATIDSYAVFFTILMYLFFWCYLDAAREPDAPRRGWLVPLALSGVCFGLGAASKWTCIYAGGGLGVLWLLDRVLRGVEQLREGKRREYIRETAENVLWCLLLFVAVPAAIYYVSYWPYGTASGMSAPGMLFTKEYARIVLDNQSYMFRYHSGVTATHPYSSVWWQWVLDIRPILYYLQYPRDGVHVSFGAWVNPALCWGGLLAMLAMAYLAIRHRDRAAAFILIGYLAQLLPWVLVTRVVFEYHYFPSTVFLLLALGRVFAAVRARHPRWRRVLGSFTAVSAGLFLVFYPALRGLPVTSWYGRSFLKWMPTWPF